MKSQQSEEKRNAKIIAIVAAFFFLFISIIVFSAISGSIKDLEQFEKANFVEVEATIIRYDEEIIYTKDNNVPIGTYYSTYYEYKSPDGEIYSACWQARIKTEEEAKAQIGTKVNIYIDHELKLQTKSLEFNKTGIGVGIGFATACLLLSLSLFTYLIVKLVRWKKNSLHSTEKANNEGKNKKPPKNFSTLNLAIILLSVFFIVASIDIAIAKEKEFKVYENAQFVEVQGEISHYNEFEKDGSAYYVTYYKYIDAEGKEYSDMWQNDIYDKAEAEAAIGSAVTLYYDSNLGVLKSMDDLIKVPKPDHTFDIIVSLIFIALFTNSAVRFIRFIVRDKRYEAEQKRQREEGQYER